MKTDFKHIITHFRKSDPILYEIAKITPFGEWIGYTNGRDTTEEIDYFAALCREIVGQQLSGKAAKKIFERFSELFKKSKITPDGVLALDDTTLREAGLSWAKIKYIKDLAQKVESGGVILDKIAELSDEDVYKMLTNVKGIGSWTVEMFLIFTLQRENVFSHGDLGLKKGIQKVYGFGNPTKEQTEELSGKWHPYKTYASVALWYSLEI